jgi:hypothetical protein
MRLLPKGSDMACYATNRLLAALIVTASVQANAQSLGDSAAVNRVMDVNQFGVPRDAKYIFCDGQDCQERTTKTLMAPKLAPATAPVVLIPQPQSVQPPAELSRAEVGPPKKSVKKRPARNKRTVKLDCRPVAEK